MSRSPRWQIWVTRILCCGIVLLAAQFGLGIATRLVAIRNVQAIIGARVDVGSSRVTLSDRRVVLNDLQIGDPRAPQTNLLEADRCELEIAAQPLLRKQTVVNRGHLTGIRFTALANEQTNSSGQTTAATANAKWFRDDADAIAAQWFAHLAERLKQDSTSQLESVQRTDAFFASWTKQSAELETRGTELNQQTAELQHAVDAAEANPLRNDKFLTDLPAQIAELQKKFAVLSAELEKLPDQLDSERRAIVAARRRDEQSANACPKIEPIETNAISAYLLRGEAAKPLEDLITLVRGVRRAILALPTTQTAERGEDILFTGCRPQSNLLIRELELQGSARIANQPLVLRGVLTNFATSPALHDEPMRLRLRTTGSLPAELQATVNRANGAHRDELIVDCQGIVFPATTLGRSDQVTMKIGPSTGTLSVSMAIDNNRLTGEIQLVQRNVHIVPVVAGEFTEVPIGSALEESLGRVDSLATRVSLSGTLAEPSCTLWSNLGPAVAEAIEHAIQRGNGQRARSLMVEAGKQTDEQLTSVERQMTEQQARWKTRIADVGAHLQAVALAETPQNRLAPDRVGRRLPSGSLFR